MSYLGMYIVNLPQFTITWTFFFGAGLISFFLHLRRSRSDFSVANMLRHCVPFDVMTSKSFHMDVIIYVWRKFTDFIFFTPGILTTAAVCATTAAVLGQVFADFVPMRTTYAVTVVCTIAIALVTEFSDYLVHFLEHKVPALWELHKVHHSADFLNPLTSKRGHSLPLVYNGVIGGLFVGAAAGILVFLFRISLVEALLLKGVASKILSIWTLDPLKHSHIPVSLGWFDRFLISPHMHQIHHSKLEPHWDKNFGTNLSLFDWLFGTAYRPAKGEQAVFGISGYSAASLQRFNTLKGAFIIPLARSWTAIARFLFGAKPPAEQSVSKSAGATAQMSMTFDPRDPL